MHRTICRAPGPMVQAVSFGHYLAVCLLAAYLWRPMLGRFGQAMLILVTPILLASLALNSMGVVAVGLLLVCLGVGFLVSALVTHRMSRKWGLLENPGDVRQGISGK